MVTSKLGDIRKRRLGKYPWDQMEVGDSFWAKTTVHALVRAAHSHAKHYNNGREYTTRTERDGARVWRIK